MKAKAKGMELVRGSGNVFADFSHANAPAEQLKALLAAQIIKVLDRQELTVRAAEAQTGIAAADFSRIRQVKLDRFTIDRLMNILERLDQRVEVKVKFKPSAHASPPAMA
jgi:predicted XRE-type DNA-binding protein